MTRDDLARIIAAAIWRPQPCMSGDIWDRLGPLRKRDAEHAADEVLVELSAGGIVTSCIREEPTPTGTKLFCEARVNGVAVDTCHVELRLRAAPRPSGAGSPPA